MSDVGTQMITLSRHILHSQRMHNNSSGDLTLLFVSIQVACKYISSQVRRAGLANTTGLAGHINIQGEEVKKLDVIANDIFINCMRSSGVVAAMISEENPNIIVVDSPLLGGKYAVVFDPLDGSSNVDIGITVGTIFGIYNYNSGGLLQKGDDLVAAGYALYGSFTSLTLAMDGVVNGYTLDPNLGEFILTAPNIKLPQSGRTYSVNEGNSHRWRAVHQQYFSYLKTLKPSYSLRYVGSMVADVHRTLLNGGVFAYPEDETSPNGKLRLIYECFPMAYVIEAAGGKAVNGNGDRILELMPERIHQRQSVFLGSSNEITAFMEHIL